MHLENLSIGSDPPNEVNAVIDVPVGGEPIKYETDKAAGMLVVDRFLYTPMRYPGNYGFIPHTLSEDGDPCDVLVANTRPLMTGCAIAVRPVGVLKMVDESGGDEKIVAVPVSRLTQRYDRVHNYTDLPEILWRQIEHFFAHYKDLEPGKWSKFDGWGDAEHAKDLIEQAIAAPAFASALAYFDGYRSERLPANLLQAQRDYFGAHTYERVDRPRGEFFHTDWTGHGGKVASTTYEA